MTMSSRSCVAWVVPLLLVLTTTCTERDLPLQGTPGRPQFDIQDGAHSGGNSHFFFLSPMVPAPSYRGTTDPTQSPVVVVCQWVTSGSSSACGTIVAFFSMSTGTGSEVVRYSASSEAYIVNWHTDKCLTSACTLDPTLSYRLRVLVGSLELGHADVVVVSNGSQLKNVETGQNIGLVDGRTLPVKFRIEQGAVALVAPGSATSVGTSGGNIVTSDGHVALAVPAGALAAPTNLTVATATSFPEGAGAWSAPVDLGPSGTAFATPVTLTLSYDPTKLPPGIPPSALSVYVSDGTGWEFVPGSTVNEVDNTVSVAISHFSTYTVLITPRVVSGHFTPTTIYVRQATTLSGYVLSYDVVPTTYCYYVYGGPFSPPQFVCITYVSTYLYALPNQAVLWTALPTGTQVISVVPTRTYTDQTGAAISPPITGLSPGTAQIVASTFGSTVQSDPVVITVVAFASVSVSAATPSVATGGTDVLTATVQDLYGAPLVSATVTWTVTAAPGVVASLEPTSGPTNGSGQATTLLTAGTTPGTAVVTATTAGVSATVSITVECDCWTTKAAMPTARYALGVGEIGGVLYAVGGLLGSTPLATVEAYDPVSNTWTTKASMPTARHRLAVGVVNGILYAVGGSGNLAGPASPLATVEAYDPATNSWTTKASMPTARLDVAVGVVNGVLYAIGGVSAAVQGVATVEAYDPATDVWTTKAPMPTARFGLGVAVINEKLYAVGGAGNAPNGGQSATVEAYDPVTDTWTTKASMSATRHLLSLGAVNGKLYAVGGERGGPTFTGSVEAYDPVTDLWTTKAAMPTARVFPGVGVVNGLLYAIGGAGPTSFTPLGTVEVYRP